MILTDLPYEILIKILEHCKVLPLTHVSQKLNEIISNSPVLMQKLNLVITEKTKCEEVKKSERKHQKVLFKFNYKINDSVLEVLRTFSDVKHVEFMRCILHEGTFIEILRALPQLKQLSIYTTYLRGIEINFSEKEKVLELGNLKVLNFRNSDQKILNLVKRSSASIHKLNVSLPHQYPISTIIEFLERHDKVASIENLTMSEIEETIITRLLCELKCLKRLSLEAESVKIESIRNLCIENTSVQHLNLYGRTSNPADLNLILNFFRGLKSLELEVNSTLEPVNFVQIQRMAGGIESLKIKNCSGDFFNHIALANLQYFEIADVTLAVTQEDWINFAQRNPKIQVLKIKDESISNDIFITICQEFRCLKELELFYDPQRLTDEVLDFISSSHLFPCNIKTLKIYQRNRQLNGFFTLTDEHKSRLKNNTGFQLILR
jgi:hypothetical protein